MRPVKKPISFWSQQPRAPIIIGFCTLAMAPAVATREFDTTVNVMLVFKIVQQLNGMVN